MRRLAERGELRPATVLAARQSTNVSLQFLGFLRERDRVAADCTQEDINAWLDGGPTTRSLARGFARWAMAQQHLPKLNFPYRVAKSAPIIGQAERVALIRDIVMDDAGIKPFVRAATLMLLLFAQPLTRIVEMKADQIVVSADGSISILGIGIDPLPVTPPFDGVFRELVDQRPNMNTAANATSQWLFPGGSPGRHFTASGLMTMTMTMTMTRESGIDLRGAKNAALRKLVLEIPATLVADAFGYSYERADIHSKAAGTRFADYAGLAVKSFHPMP